MVDGQVHRSLAVAAGRLARGLRPSEMSSDRGDRCNKIVGCIPTHFFDHCVCVLFSRESDTRAAVGHRKNAIAFVD